MGCEVYLGNHRMDKFEETYKKIRQELTTNFDLKNRMLLFKFAFNI
jgi:hypothetical protein